MRHTKVNSIAEIQRCTQNSAVVSEGDFLGKNVPCEPALSCLDLVVTDAGSNIIIFFIHIVGNNLDQKGHSHMKITFICVI